MVDDSDRIIEMIRIKSGLEVDGANGPLQHCVTG